MVLTTRGTLELPTDLVTQAYRLAELEHRSLDEVISEYLAEVLTPFPLDEGHDQMQEEEAVYRALHPQLVEMYLGQFVAVHHGAVVDCDSDQVTLLKRIRQQLPEQVVLLRQVQSELPRDKHWSTH